MRYSIISLETAKQRTFFFALKINGLVGSCFDLVFHGPLVEKLFRLVSLHCIHADFTETETPKRGCGRYSAVNQILKWIININIKSP